MRQIICICLTAALLLPLAGCGGQVSEAASFSQDTASSAAQAYTFTDDLGRSVTVDTPRRVAALIGSFADVWCLAGGKDTLVAAAHDAWTSFELGLDGLCGRPGGGEGAQSGGAALRPAGLYSGQQQHGRRPGAAGDL